MKKYITIVDCMDQFESPNITYIFDTLEEANDYLSFYRKFNEWHILGELEILEESGKHIV